jgi:hypothetical protein
MGHGGWTPTVVRHDVWWSKLINFETIVLQNELKKILSYMDPSTFFSNGQALPSFFPLVS